MYLFCCDVTDRAPYARNMRAPHRVIHQRSRVRFFDFGQAFVLPSLYRRGRSIVAIVALRSLSGATLIDSINYKVSFKFTSGYRSIDASQRTNQLVRKRDVCFLRIEHQSYKTLHVSEILASKHLRSTLISYNFVSFLCFSTTRDEVNKLIRKSRIDELDGFCWQVYTVTNARNTLSR